MKKILSSVFVKILGIILIIAGVVMISSVIYSVTIGDDVTAAKQSAFSQEFEERMKASASESMPISSPEPVVESVSEPVPEPVPVPELVVEPVPEVWVEPPILLAPAYGEAFAVLHVPRFGKDYSRVIAEGVNEDVLNSPESGVGHVPETQSLGELGNFAIAGHRKNNGGTFRNIDKLQANDLIIVETEAGSYYYHYVSREIVDPTQVSVLFPVPNKPDTPATERVITIISCYPLYSSAERIIAYGVFDKFVPR